ncbi:unnamed protein product [Paramecium primaurelia]|uniref:Uncharacterized protein n=1 Tax=Paramecium primaurelia TaxID=5886 RepID=A0A8S1LF99_PARPR|nr:unnamed protein product [Paramecium primaurelia]
MEEDLQQSQNEPNLYSSHDEYPIQNHHSIKKIVSSSLTQQMNSLKINTSSSRRISKSKANGKLKYHKNINKKKESSQHQDSQKEETQFDLYTQEYKQIQVCSFPSTPSLY